MNLNDRLFQKPLTKASKQAHTDILAHTFLKAMNTTTHTKTHTQTDTKIPTQKKKRQTVHYMVRENHLVRNYSALLHSGLGTSTIPQKFQFWHFQSSTSEIRMRCMLH